MNSKLILIPILLILLSSVSVSAQSDTTSFKTSWFVSLHSGVLIGKPGLAGKPGNTTSVSATLMTGVRLDRIALSVGVGHDTYLEWKLIPVFAGIGYDFLKKKNYQLGLHFNAGYAHAWHTSVDTFEGQVKNEGGYFYHPFIGVRIQPGGIDIFFSAGYKIQSLTYEHVPTWSWGFKTTTQAEMQRLSIQMGIGI